VSTLTFAVLDPTSNVAGDLVERLAGAFPSARRRLFHTSDSDEHLISEVAGAAELVPPLADPDELDGSAVVIVTVPPAPAMARSLLAWMRGHPETVLIDLGQPALAGTESAVVSGWLPRPPGTGRWYHLPNPLIAGPVRVLEALAPFEPRACHLTVFGSVAGFGAGALEELAGQGADRLSGRTPQRATVLPRVLAFDPPRPSRRGAGGWRPSWRCCFRPSSSTCTPSTPVSFTATPRRSTSPARDRRPGTAPARRCAALPACGWPASARACCSPMPSRAMRWCAGGSRREAGGCRCGSPATVSVSPAPPR
jgi:hypothetical protein